MEKAPRFTVSGEKRRRAAEARVGQSVLGKWRLNRLLGVGELASVFEATHANGSRAAIKLLHPDLVADGEARERFLAEGYAANRVAHPGVVSVRDEGTTDDGAVFLVMDLLQGQTLAARLQGAEPGLSVGEVLELTRQLLDILVHAQNRGVVHGNITPESVFLTREGRVRLLHFGVERWADQDGRSDLWSLGALLYFLLSGSRVSEVDSNIRSLGEVAALPRSVVAVVDRALALERHERFPDARSMQLALRAALEELRAPSSRPTLPPPSLEPLALSLRTPRPKVPTPRPLPSSAPAPQPHVPTYGTVRPVATTTPLPAPARSTRSALPLFVSIGFVVGLGIVLTVRLNVRPAGPAEHWAPERAAAVLLPEPSSASSASAAPSTTAAPAPLGSAGPEPQKGAAPAKPGPPKN